MRPVTLAILALAVAAAAAILALSTGSDAPRTRKRARTNEPVVPETKQPPPPPTPAVAEMLNRDADGRRASIRELRKSKDIKGLIAALRSGDTELRLLVIDALGRLKAKEAVRHLIESGNDPGLLPAILKALKQIADKSAVPFLAGLLGHESDDIAHAAAAALDPLEADALPALPQLIELVKAHRKKASRAALSVMEAFGPDALPALPILIREVEEASDWEMGAMDVIKAIGPQAASAAPALAKRMFDFERMKSEFERRSTGLMVSWVAISFHASRALAAIGAEASVPELVKGLGDPVWGVRYHAADSLSDFGAKAIPALNRVAKEGNAKAREAVAELFGKFADKHPDLLDEVLRLLRDPERKVRAEAAAALTKFGARVLPHLLKAMQDPAITRAAVQAIGNLGKKAAPAIGDLADLAAHKEAWVRARVAQTLGSIGDPLAIPPLVALLADENEDVRESAGVALSKVGKPARAALITVIRNGPERARSEAARALARIGGADDVHVELIKSKDAGVRLTAALALARARKRGDLAIPVLRDALKPDPKIHQYDGAERLADVLAALAAYGKPAGVAVPEAVTLLQYAIKKRYWIHNVSKRITEGLGGIAKYNVEPVFGLFDTEDINLHFIAVRAVVKAGKAALPKTRELALSGTPREQEAAVRVLDGLQDKLGLEQMLDHRNEEAREEAARAYHRLTKDTNRVLPVLLDLIERGKVQGARNDAAWYLQSEILVAAMVPWLEKIRQLANGESDSYIQYLLKKAIQRIENR